MVTSLRCCDPMDNIATPHKPILLHMHVCVQHNESLKVPQIKSCEIKKQNCVEYFSNIKCL